MSINETIVFEFERSTKNMHRFSEVPEEEGRPVVGTLYINKSAFKDGVPKEITVRIKSSKNGGE